MEAKETQRDTGMSGLVTRRHVMTAMLTCSHRRMERVGVGFSKGQQWQKQKHKNKPCLWQMPIKSELLFVCLLVLGLGFVLWGCPSFFLLLFFLPFCKKYSFELAHGYITNWWSVSSWITNWWSVSSWITDYLLDLQCEGSKCPRPAPTSVPDLDPLTMTLCHHSLPYILSRTMYLGVMTQMHTTQAHSQNSYTDEWPQL